MSSSGPLLTAQQACEELFSGHERRDTPQDQLDRRKNLYKLYRMFDRGEIEGFKIGSSWHVHRSEVERFQNMGAKNDTG